MKKETHLTLRFLAEGIKCFSLLLVTEKGEQISFCVCVSAVGTASSHRPQPEIVTLTARGVGRRSLLL